MGEKSDTARRSIDQVAQDHVESKRRQGIHTTHAAERERVREAIVRAENCENRKR